MIAAALLILFAAVFVWFVRSDGPEYERFKALAESRDRQRRFGVWIAKSFAIFSVGSVVSLALVGRLASIIHFPPEFETLRAMLPAPPDLSGLGDMAIGFVGAVAGVALAAWFILRRRGTSAKASGPVVLGDIEPLLPRNGAERWWATLLALNAGLSEELCFRLALPLLLTIVTGNVFVAFGVAAIVFGLVHLYQGWTGVLATTVLGLALSAAYLIFASIWVAVVFHALIDLNGLILMPLLTRRSA
jgi:membrane protease YdiL (CAAX protease family)